MVQVFASGEPGQTRINHQEFSSEEEAAGFTVQDDGQGKIFA